MWIIMNSIALFVFQSKENGEKKIAKKISELHSRSVRFMHKDTTFPWTAQVIYFVLDSRMFTSKEIKHFILLENERHRFNISKPQNIPNSIYVIFFFLLPHCVTELHDWKYETIKKIKWQQ